MLTYRKKVDVIVMGIFDKLFGKKQAQPPAEIRSINITESGLEIDGNPMNLPTHISVAEKLFGKPRKIVYEMDKNTQDYLESIRGKGMVTKRVNYAWDDIGVYCYTDNGAVLSAFGIRLSKQGDEYKHYPRSPFGGTVTINGKPWFGIINTAEDREVFRRHEMDCYSVVGEYTDPFDEPDARTEKGYSCIEVNMK